MLKNRIKKFFPLLFALLLAVVLLLFPSQKAEAISYSPEGVSIQTDAVGLYNLETGQSVFLQNETEKRYPASLTKIMTYIVAVEAIPDLENTTITVTKQALDSLLGTGSSLSGVLEGEKLTALQLLHLMMIPSGNDAAAVLSDYVGGGKEEAFVEKMNQKAKELGLTNTHFQNSHGLHDENHYTTVKDMYTMTKYAMNLPYFTEITSMPSYELPATNKSPEPRTVISTNKMLMNYEPDYYYTYARGIKTGTTDEAGYCLVSTAVYDGSSYLCVAMKAPSVDKDGNVVEKRRDMIDSANLYRWAFTQLAVKTIAEKNSPVAEIPLNYTVGKDTMLLAPEATLSAVLPAEVTPQSLLMTTDLPESVSAPLKAGDVIGTATYTYAGQEVGTINLVATEDVNRSEFLVVTSGIFGVLRSPIFWLVVGVVVVLAVGYVLFAMHWNKKRRRR